MVADKLLTTVKIGLALLPIPVAADAFKVLAVTLLPPPALILPAAVKLTVSPDALIAPLEAKTTLLLAEVTFMLIAEVNSASKVTAPPEVNNMVPPVVTCVGLTAVSTVMPLVIPLEPIVKPPVDVIVFNSVLVNPNIFVPFPAPS